MNVKILLGVKSNLVKLSRNWKGSDLMGDGQFALALLKAYKQYAFKVTNLNLNNELSQKFKGSHFSLTNRVIDYSDLPGRNLNQLNDAKVAAEMYYKELLNYLSDLNTLEAQRMLNVIKNVSSSSLLTSTEYMYSNTSGGSYNQGSNTVLVPCTVTIDFCDDNAANAAFREVGLKTTSIDKKYNLINKLFNWPHINKITDSEVLIKAYKEFTVKSIKVVNGKATLTTFKRFDIHSLFGNLDDFASTVTSGFNDKIKELDVDLSEIENDAYLKRSLYGAVDKTSAQVEFIVDSRKFTLMGDMSFSNTDDGCAADIASKFVISGSIMNLLKKDDVFQYHPLMSIALIKGLANDLMTRVEVRKSFSVSDQVRVDAFMFLTSSSQAEYIGKKRLFLQNKNGKTSDAIIVNDSRGVSDHRSIRNYSPEPFITSDVYSMNLGSRSDKANVFQQIIIPPSASTGLDTAFEFNGNVLFRFINHPDCCGLSIGFGFNNHITKAALEVVNKYITDYAAEKEVSHAYALAKFRGLFWSQCENDDRFRPVMQFTLAKYQREAVDLIKILGGVEGVSFINNNSGNNINTLYLPTKIAYMSDARSSSKGDGGSRGPVVNVLSKRYKAIGDLGLQVSEWYTKTKDSVVSNAKAKTMSK